MTPKLLMAASAPAITLSGSDDDFGITGSMVFISKRYYLLPILTT